MIATPPQSEQSLPGPEVIGQNQQGNFRTSASFGVLTSSDSMQGVEVKSPVRPRTRFERLTEKHTAQRPNWAVADPIPSTPHSGTTSRPAKLLRRVPNAIFHMPPVELSLPTPGQRERKQRRTARETDATRTDSGHTGERPNRALAGAPTPSRRTPQALPREEEWHGISPRDKPVVGHGNIHPSRVGLITDRSQPFVTPPSLVTRGPVDSGWGQRRYASAFSLLLLLTCSQISWNCQTGLGPYTRSPNAS